MKGCLNCKKKNLYPSEIKLSHVFLAIDGIETSYILNLCDKCLPDKNHVDFEKINSNNVGKILHQSLRNFYVDFENKFSHLYLLNGIKCYEETPDKEIKHYWKKKDLSDISKTNLSNYKCPCVECNKKM